MHITLEGSHTLISGHQKQAIICRRGSGANVRRAHAAARLWDIYMDPMTACVNTDTLRSPVFILIYMRYNWSNLCNFSRIIHK